MRQKKIGKVLFWLGVALIFINYIAIWISTQTAHVNTPETLIGTGWAFGESLSTISGFALNIGIIFSLIGALLYSGKKGSFFWLWALVPIIGMNVGMLWHPSKHIPAVYGIGAGIITLAYLGVLWVWIMTHNAYEGIAKTGKQIQLLGYSFLYITAIFLCNYIGNPMVPGLADFPLVSGYSILIALSVGFVLLSIGHFLTGQQKE